MWYRLKSGTQITRQLSIFLSPSLTAIFFFLNFYFFFFFFFLFKNFFSVYFYFCHECLLTLRCPFITTGSCVPPTNLYRTLILYIGLLAMDFLWGEGSKSLPQLGVLLSVSGRLLQPLVEHGLESETLNLWQQKYLQGIGEHWKSLQCCAASPGRLPNPQLFN